MSESRRGFLKLFGAGATVVPLLAGKPVIEATAKLIEPPKVELAHELSNPADYLSPTFMDKQACGGYQMLVTFLDSNGKRAAMIAPRSFVTNVLRSMPIPIRDPLGREGDLIGGGIQSIGWYMEGRCYLDERGRWLDIYQWEEQGERPFKFR